jgi:hypothetical protein
MLALMIRPAKRGGRPRDVNVREVLNAIFYVLSSGCQWKALPKDLPPKARRTITSCCGTGTARLSVSITFSMSLYSDNVSDFGNHHAHTACCMPVILVMSEDMLSSGCATTLALIQCDGH